MRTVDRCIVAAGDARRQHPPADDADHGDVDVVAVAVVAVARGDNCVQRHCFVHCYHRHLQQRWPAGYGGSDYCSCYYCSPLPHSDLVLRSCHRGRSTSDFEQRFPTEFASFAVPIGALLRYHCCCYYCYCDGNDWLAAAVVAEEEPAAGRPAICSCCWSLGMLVMIDSCFDSGSNCSDCASSGSRSGLFEPVGTRLPSDW